MSNPTDFLQAMLGGIVAVLAFVLVLAILRSLVRVCPSNHILVITGGTETEVAGRKYGFRIQRGGWTFVMPFIQSAQSIDLTILPINVKIEGVQVLSAFDIFTEAVGISRKEISLVAKASEVSTRAGVSALNSAASRFSTSKWLVAPWPEMTMITL